MVNWLLASFHWLLIIGGLLLLIAACLVAWVIQQQPWAWRDDDKQGHRYYRTSFNDHRRWVVADDAGWIDGSWRWKWQARLEARKWTVTDEPPEYESDDWQIPLPPIEDEPGDEWATELHAIAIDLPGPVAGAEAPGYGRAGELHSYADAFPPVLQLGRPFDGGDKTAARVELHRLTVWNRVEAARRELALECGITYRPMEAIAA